MSVKHLFSETFYFFIHLGMITMRFFFTALLMFVSCWGYAEIPSSMKVSSSRSSFVVKLPANPTTGYQWSVTSYDKTLLQLIRSDYRASETKLIGAGGVMAFTFKLRSGKTYPAMTKMGFTYARPWDKTSGNLNQISIMFVRP